MPESRWPITRADLDPFYARAQKNLDLAPYNYSLDFWQKRHPSFKPLLPEDQVIWNNGD